MKGFIKKALGVALAMTFAFGSVACGEAPQNGRDGADGIGVKSAQIVNGELQLILTDDRMINAGAVVGQNGLDGDSLASADIQADGTLLLTFASGKTLNVGDVLGKDGAPGKDGADGKDGDSVVDAEIDANGTLFLVFASGKKVNVGNVKGDTGADGKDGENGKDGADGENGKDGADGKDGENGKDADEIVDAKVEEDGMLVLIFASGKTLNVGDVVTANGQDGKDGEDGVGIRSILLEGDNLIVTLTDDTRLDLGSVRGNAGADGKDGTDGKDGIDGIDGVDGKNVTFRVENGWMQWKYDTDEEWINLYEINGTPAPEGLVKLTYKLSGGTLNGEPTEVHVTAGTSVYLPTPSYRGYTFEGWFLENGTMPVTSPYRVHQSENMYAKWTAGATITGTKIYTVEDLAAINNNLGGTYVLMNDIDCAGLALPPIGADAGTPFTGIFEGQGYTVSNFKCGAYQYFGLFGYNSGTIRNLQIKDTNLTYNGSLSFSKYFVGCIAGVNYGTISKCNVTNSNIDLRAGATTDAGLLVGNNGGKIENCYATGSVKISTWHNNYHLYAGGLVGYNESGSISNCYTVTSISVVHTADSVYILGADAGGIAGQNAANATIQGCILLGGSVSADGQGDERKGDIYGGYKSGTVSECFRSESFNISGGNSYATVMPIATMNTSSFYNLSLKWDSAIWDWSNINIAEGIYPTLIYNF